MNLTFDDFVSALPDEVYDEARYSIGLSEAFRSAVNAGWPVDTLIDDALMTLRRPGSRVSWLVIRFRSFAERRPTDGGQAKIKLPPNTITKMPAGHPFESWDGTFCQVCQLPLANRAHNGFTPRPVVRQPLEPEPVPDWDGEW